MIYIGRYTIHFERSKLTLRSVMKVEVFDSEICTEDFVLSTPRKYSLEEYNELLHLMNILDIRHDYYELDDFYKIPVQVL